MRPAPAFDKLMEMHKLKRGDIIKTTTGETFEFQSLKQKNFVGKKSDGTMWSVSINNFKELVEKAPEVKIGDKTSEIMTLKQGELFYILHKEQTVVFKFEGIKGNKIKGKNPVTGMGATMDIGMYGGRVSDL